MEACGLRRVMKEVRDTVARIMESTTLADLVDDQTPS
jgi:DNA-binding IscR family transcriptional regulator